MPSTNEQRALATTPFGAATTAAEVIAGVDLRQRRVVVTGGASGIGLETARNLAAGGAEVTLAVRDLEAGSRAATEIASSTGNDRVRIAQLDLADRGSIAAFASNWAGPLDVLVNNAGVMAVPQRQLTGSGWELQLAVNHLGSAELTHGLFEALKSAEAARVVQVSSSAHQLAPADFADPHFADGGYEAWTAYGRSKTAMILFAVALAERWAEAGISVNVLHPGGIMTNLQRHLDDAQLSFVGAKDGDGNTLAVPPGWKSVEQGAATSVLLAASPFVEGVTGRYFEDVNEAEVQPDPGPGKPGVAAYAVDRELASRMWDLTASHLAF
jgi:NAD(P)-dependent dehydrogenase (short-subunit alcohol dehydrogenase family)